jgi:PTH1 family peptidyl-tRNA hydrolase
MKIIVGLGNPGKDYADTRHNVGFMLIDHLREQLNFPQWHRDSKSQAEISEGQLNQEKVILLKPQTFMNESGQSVGYLFHFYKLAPMDVIVIHDEIDLPFGRYKVQHDVSSAGHNGIKSIIEKMGTQMFHRVRVGIGKEDKDKQGDTADFVLGRFSFFEKLKLKNLKELITEETLKLL